VRQVPIDDSSRSLIERERSHVSHPDLPWLFVSALVVGCAGNTREETGAAAAQSVDEVTDQPEDFIGRSVTVRGEMDDVRGLRAFTLEDHDWVFPEELLAVAPKQPAGTVGGLDSLEDKQVTVRGTIRKLVVADVEREFDLDLDPEFELEFRDRPILIAGQITPDPSSEETALTGESPDSVTTVSVVAPITDVLLLVPVPGPADLVGKEARLADAEVRSRVGERGVWVGPCRVSGASTALKRSWSRAGKRCTSRPTASPSRSASRGCRFEEWPPANP
jgi:hypothetical protein